MESNFRYKLAFHLKRMFIVLGALSGTFSMLLLFSERFSYFIGGSGEFNYGGSTAIASLLVSAISFSLVYLQSGASSSSVEADLSNSAYLNKANKTLEEVERRNLEFTNKLTLLEERLDEAEFSTGLTAEERGLVVNGAIKSASSEAIKEVFALEAEKFESHLADNLGLDRLASISKSSVERLMREISDLRLRSNINLLIGMTITAGGLWLLWTTVSIVDASELLKTLASGGAESDSQFLKSLILPIIPRVLLVVFVEVFAYFFLRLYRNGLSEIKYFQNELTNIESKLTAIEFAYVTKNDSALKAAIEALSSTERNFVLDKGQTTVELERARSETELSRTLVKALPKILLERKK